MRLQRLELTNFRRFERFEVDLHPQVTLLVGGNGSGKSTLLDAAVMLIDRYSRLGNSGARQLSVDDQRRRSVEGRHHTFTETVEPCVISGRFEGEAEPTTLSWDKQATGIGPTSNVPTRKPRPLLRYIAAEVSEQSDPRLVQGHIRPLGTPGHAYRSCLEGRWDRLRLSDWFQWREDIRLQELSDAVDGGGDISTIKDEWLEAMNRQLAAVFDLERLVFRKKERRLLARFQGEPWLAFDVHSLGRRRAVQIVAELTWMAFHLNPQLGYDAPVETPGIVLIDELALHLHPTWQRELLQKLVTAFPVVQFIVTTHSPQVVAGAKPEWIRILTDEGAREIGHSLGRDSSSLLKEVFSVDPYPREVIERYNRGLALVDGGNLEAAQAIALQLEQQLGPVDSLVQGLYFELTSAVPVASDG